MELSLGSKTLARSISNLKRFWNEGKNGDCKVIDEVITQCRNDDPHMVPFLLLVMLQFKREELDKAK